MVKEGIASICATEGLDHVGYLTRLAEQEMIERDRHKVERRVKAARFPVVKSLDSFDFAAIPRLNDISPIRVVRARCCADPLRLRWCARATEKLSQSAEHDKINARGGLQYASSC